ncbi:hypothetical protein HDA32_002551 [Spinactinospora alkalitolerans]|uniref:Integral membrane bound transporter domain-containing protein n=1 Tax=Spinactinospora alkalitolerans TaxID=687207 RepID=A0A852TUS4_9ACTN|nr:FUSC family protein [Spinactinospora alkalitolerans]NYE47431.1 hypothetical protein [Spinactinospora alkalitolerans]
MNDLVLKRHGPLFLLLRVLSPRDALRLRALFGGVAVPSLRIGVCVTIPLVALLTLDRVDLIPYAAFGSFTALYCRNDPYARRARLLALVGAGLVLCVLTGALTSLLTDSGVVKVIAVAAVAAAAKLVADARALGPPGGLMFVFAAGAAAYAPQAWSTLPWVAASTASAALLCWCVALLGRLAHRTAPQRLATARALVAVAAFLTAEGAALPAARHQAHLEVRRSWQALQDGSVTAGSEAVHRLEALTARAESLLHAPGTPPTNARTAAGLRELARRTRLRRLPDVLSTDSERAEPRSRAEQVRGAASTDRPLAPRAGLRRLSPLLPGAARVGVACLLAGLTGIALGFDHAYWALVSAGAVLQTVNVTTTWHRTLQRAAGTLLGAGLAIALFGLDPAPAVILVVIVACQIGAELVVMVNYAFAIVFVTPLTLALTHLTHPAPTDAVVAERVAATLIGALIGVVVSIAVVNGGALPRLRAALQSCMEAEARLRRVREESPEEVPAARDRLAHAVVALREAYSVAGGEPWTNGFSTEEVMDAEQAAYAALTAASRRETAPAG